MESGSVSGELSSDSKISPIGTPRGTLKAKTKKRLTVDVNLKNHRQILQRNGGCCGNLMSCFMTDKGVRDFIRKKIAKALSASMKKNGIQTETQILSDGDPEIRMIVRHMNRVKQMAMMQIIRFKLKVCEHSILENRINNYIHSKEGLKKKGAKFDLKVKRITYSQNILDQTWVDSGSESSVQNIAS